MVGIFIVISSPVVAIIFTTVSNPIFLCILGGQLLINLKEAGELGVNEGTNYRSTSVTVIDFAEGRCPLSLLHFANITHLFQIPASQLKRSHRVSKNPSFDVPSQFSTFLRRRSLVPMLYI